MGFMSPQHNLYSGYHLGDTLPDGTVIQKGRSPWEKATNFLSDAAGAIKDTASSAWDVFSGERDWRRQKALQEETWKREDSAFQRSAADLAAAGINPMLAGQLGPAHTSAPVAQSRTAEGVGRIAGLAGGILSGSVNAVKSIAESGLARATSARQLADAASITARLPSGIAKDLALAALHSAQVPQAQASTAESISRRRQADVRTAQMREEMPRFAAEAAYYKRYGQSAVLARENRNPWQTGLLVVDQAGRGPIQNTVNSASSVLSDVANDLKRRSQVSPKRRASAYSGARSSYYERR